jgi:signal transduction histidine kinase
MTGATVLVVEDDAGLATLQRRRLERAGYVVVSAATAADGLDRAKQGGVGLLILDQNLPGGATGLGLYRQVREAGLDVPAILVTGFTSMEVVVDALRAGVHDFLPKTPEYLDHLLPAVERVLRDRQSARDLASAREGLVREQAARTAAEQVAAALREADKRKDEFLATLAHELRNPLAPLRNALHIMTLTDASLPPAVRQTRDVMERQLGHMVRLIDDLLDLSRVSRGKIALKREQTDLAAAVRAAVETSRPLIEKAGHELTIALPAGPVRVDGDPVRLAQVFANLLNNAAKYTDPGGSIRLTATADGAAAEVRVRDTGVGIPAEALPRVFDMFVQVDKTLDRAQGGLGIGLSLVRELVALHGGTIEAFSDGPGRGSEFVVRLPVLEDHPPAAGP